MAKRNSNSTTKKVTVSVLTVGKDEFERVLQERITLGEEIHDRKINTRSELNNAQNDYYAWDDYNLEYLTHAFDNPDSEYKQAYGRVNSFFITVSGKTDAQKVTEFREDVENKVNHLKKLIAKISLLKSEDNQRQIAQISSIKSNMTDVFIVHGHNNEIKVTTALILQRLGLNPIILHEQANSGRTIIEKFEAHSNVGFAVVLLTADDEGKAKNGEALQSRARQNVILELGYFIGKLGRDRVCPLYGKGVELPSDLSGVVYVPIDENDAWKFSLAKELRAAGYEIDLNKL